MHHSLKLLRRRWSFESTFHFVLDPAFLVTRSTFPIFVVSTKKPCITYGLQCFVAPNTFFIFLHHFHFCMSLHFFARNADAFWTLKVPMTRLATFKTCTRFLRLDGRARRGDRSNLDICLARSAGQSHVFCPPIDVRPIPIMNCIFAPNRTALRLVICYGISNIKMLLE